MLLQESLQVHFQLELDQEVGEVSHSILQANNNVRLCIAIAASLVV